MYRYQWNMISRARHGGMKLREAAASYVRSPYSVLYATAVLFFFISPVCLDAYTYTYVNNCIGDDAQIHFSCRH